MQELFKQIALGNHQRSRVLFAKSRYAKADGFKKIISKLERVRSCAILVAARGFCRDQVHILFVHFDTFYHHTVDFENSFPSGHTLFSKSTVLEDSSNLLTGR